MDMEKIPCCASDALWRVRKLKINGIMTGISGLEECMTAIREMDPAEENAIRAALMEKVRTSNYVPPGAEEAYGKALMEEYRKIPETRCGCNGCGGNEP
jgi:hypothetical protein